MDNPSFSEDFESEKPTERNGSISSSNQVKNDLKSPLEDILNIPVKSRVSSYGPKETRRMMKNVLVASVGFLFLFTAYNGMSNVMSSLYPQVLFFVIIVAFIILKGLF